MGDNKHVLIVEDEKPLSRALELKLGAQGYTITLATNGQEALEAVEKGGIDVMLLDLMMPTLDGFQVLEQMKGIANPPTVFVLSNLSQHEDEQRVLALGAKKFFIKSDTPLSTIVEEVRNA
jgi:two-component system OmpR family response regulator